MEINWRNRAGLQSRRYTCGHCNSSIASDHGFSGSMGAKPQEERFIYICSHCSRPTYFDKGSKQIPEPGFGNSVDHLPPTVAAVYNEARNCMKVGAYTSAVMSCRKLLMHIAVEKGAKPGASFASYVNYLTENHYVPPNSKHWIDQIRGKGNEANHEIVIMKRDEAELLIEFLEMLLKFIYEYPGKMAQQVKDSEGASEAGSATPG